MEPVTAALCCAQVGSHCTVKLLQQRTLAAPAGSFDFGNSFYSTKAAGMHVIFLNSFTGTDVDSPQFKWLKQDLRWAITRKRRN